MLQLAEAPSTARNPFRGKGLRVPVALLLEPERSWTIRGLAEHTGVSLALASGVVRRLRDEGALPDDLVQGRRAAVTATPTLLEAVARHWPHPTFYVWGGTAPSQGVPLGGGPALSEAGFLHQDRPRAYVRDRAGLLDLLAMWGGNEGSPAAADWEITMLDIDLPIGVLPPPIAALELGADPRGREMLHERAEDLLTVVG